MGIPVYFKHCIQDYDKICFKVSNQSVDYLFLDSNCLIHPCCQGETDESIMIENIIHKIRELYSLVNPKKGFYIAIDGPCPKPKILQQRTRRFLSSQIEKPWDTNAITPGTQFMNTLDKIIQHMISEFQVKTWFSSSQDPGEGEHKIFDFIKHQTLDNVVVYGLDADLIMLSMISDCQNIFLLRETTEYKIEHIDSEYIYLDSNKLKQQIIKEIRPNVYMYDDSTLIQDYCFLCFLLGNDFVKHSPSLNLRYDGLTVIKDTYKQLCESSGGIFYLVDKKQPCLIHVDNLKQLFKCLSDTENSRLRNILSIRNNQEKKWKRIYHSKQDKTEVDVHKPIIFRKKEKQIFQDMTTWKQKYYLQTVYNETDTNFDKQKLETTKQTMCKTYIQSLLWTLMYYTKGCEWWDFSYDYMYAPPIQDVYEYLKTNPVNLQTNKTPYTSEQQLQMALPLSSHHLLNESYTPDVIFYPQHPQTCFLLKRYTWEQQLYLPKI